MKENVSVRLYIPGNEALSSAGVREKDREREGEEDNEDRKYCTSYQEKVRGGGRKKEIREFQSQRERVGNNKMVEKGKRGVFLHSHVSRCCSLT